MKLCCLCMFASSFRHLTSGLWLWKITPLGKEGSVTIFINFKNFGVDADPGIFKLHMRWLKMETYFFGVVRYTFVRITDFRILSILVVRQVAPPVTGTIRAGLLVETTRENDLLLASVGRQ